MSLWDNKISKGLNCMLIYPSSILHNLKRFTMLTNLVWAHLRTWTSIGWMAQIQTHQWTQTIEGWGKNSLLDKNPPNKVGNFMSFRSDINIPTKRKRNGKNEVPKNKNKNSHTEKI